MLDYWDAHKHIPYQELLLEDCLVVALFIGRELEYERAVDGPCALRFDEDGVVLFKKRVSKIEGEFRCLQVSVTESVDFLRSVLLFVVVPSEGVEGT